MLEQLTPYLTGKNIGIATTTAVAMIGAYVQFRGDPTPTENILDDIRAMQAGCQKDKEAWQNLLAKEAVELKECRTEVRNLRYSEDNNIKNLEDRVAFLETSMKVGEITMHTETAGNLPDSNDGDNV